MKAGDREAVWDGKDLAAVQMAVLPIRRAHGGPVLEVDADWNLAVHGVELRVGDRITVTEDGAFEIDDLEAL